MTAPPDEHTEAWPAALDTATKTSPSRFNGDRGSPSTFSLLTSLYASPNPVWLGGRNSDSHLLDRETEPRKGRVAWSRYGLAEPRLEPGVPHAQTKALLCQQCVGLGGSQRAPSNKGKNLPSTRLALSTSPANSSEVSSSALGEGPSNPSKCPERS